MKKLIIFSVFLSFFAISFVSPVFAKGIFWEYKVVNMTEDIQAIALKRLSGNLRDFALASGAKVDKTDVEQVPENEQASKTVSEKDPLVSAYEEKLNLLGADGWELVGFDLTTGLTVFKKKK